MGEGDWGYTCGRINAREPRTMLGRAVFESVLRAGSLTDAYHVISQTILKQAFVSPDDLADFDARLSLLERQEVLGVVETAPMRVVGALFLWPEAFARLRRRLSELVSSGAPEEDLSAALREAFRSDPGLTGIGEVMDEDGFARLSPGEPGATGADHVAGRMGGLTLDLDRKLLTALALAATALRQEAEVVADVMADAVAAKMAGSLARALAAGADTEATAASLSAGPLGELLGEKGARRHRTPEEVVAELAPSAAGAAPFDAERFPLLVDAALGERLEGLSRVPFGAERAFQYLAAFHNQICNARLALAAVKHRLDRADVERRLRRESVG